MDAKQKQQIIESYRQDDPTNECPTYQQEQFMRRHGLWSDCNCYSRKEVAQIIRNFIAEQRSKKGR